MQTIAEKLDVLLANGFGKSCRSDSNVIQDHLKDRMRVGRSDLIRSVTLEDATAAQKRQVTAASTFSATKAAPASGARMSTILRSESFIPFCVKT